MKILVIGSKGFIGSHIYEYFKKSHEVWGADIIEDKSAKNYFLLSRQNTQYEEIFDNNQFDVCVNASGNGSVPISLNRPVFDFELNVTNTLKVLDAIRINNPTCKYISMSSAAVYGNPVSLPIEENTALIPMSPYGWHKLYAEQICKEYYYLYDLHTINLRLFSVYGENLKKQLFWDTYQKCKHTTEIELFGTGNETRDFIYVSDLLHAIDCIVKRGLFNGESVNVASGIETTIKEAATVFCEYVDKKIKVKFNKITKPGDPLNWRADIGVLRSWGFEPGFSITEGLKGTVAWLKENA
ncbi:NAD-dependent epimerase/dehydratase family protein [Mucilaginibacter sp. dw_454]|uniref:NAD-dependent epimerase/dehydratase family protein n=1 Tax=Mucilaginibacter sp. dw_454 TaxID=2720079 RepID=UPI001BD3ED4B|nr:NAD-dependent epimerase/dehydratase family protein [Mucilaginibacter sp. dw_454]